MAKSQKTTTPATAEATQPEVTTTGATETATQTLIADDETTRETEVVVEGKPDVEPVEGENTEWVIEKIAPYLESYPDETLFHITSDGQVFLGKDLTFAKEHQATLNDGGDLYTFRVQA